jgi:PAS domain S-box-containing protein
MVTNPDTEIRRLRIGLRDLVALSTIPAAWVGREPSAIAAGLADVLIGTLHLDGAFVRLCDPRGGATVEVTRGNASNGFKQSLQRHLAAVGRLSRGEVIRDLDGAERCRALVIPIGVDAEGGLVAARCERPDFPTEVDQLLLSVAANHAATAFQSARVQQELRQARNGLERKVAERTAQLLRDIEDRRRVEEALRQSEEQWRDVFENNPTMYFMVDAAGRIIAVNPFGAEQLGYTVDELVGQPVLTVFDDSDREAIDREVAGCLKQLGRARTWEVRKVRKDGTMLRVRETAKAVTRASGPIVLIAGEDITEMRRAEEALRQAQADLVHVSRVTTLGEMAASIAHEVDQPLSGVVINANACLRFLAGASPNLDEVRDGLHAIARDGRRAADVIARIRTLARRTATEKEPLDVNEVIGDVIAVAGEEARRTRARVRTDLAGSLPRVIGDRVQLQQVVLNLLLNGLEAMHGVGRRPRELVIRTQREAIDRVHVAVQDSGSGIDPQLAHRIFDAFYTTKPGGMGLGLSISRSIVEQHGGRLWAVPNDGAGTTFHFVV